MPVAKQLEEEAKKQDDKEAQEAARRLQRLAKQLERGQLDKKLALLKLDQSKVELQKITDRLAPPRPKTAEEAARQMQQAASQRPGLEGRGHGQAGRAARGQAGRGAIPEAGRAGAESAQPRRS